MEIEKAFVLWDSLLDHKNIAKLNTVLIGSLLGDCHLQFSPRQSCIDFHTFPRIGTTRFRFGQKTSQKTYVDSVYGLTHPLCTSVQKPRSENDGNFYSFYSSSLEELTRYHEVWYRYDFLDSTKNTKSFVKCLPLSLEKILVDPISFFLWYLDDGSLRTDCNAARFASQCFSYEEHELLRAVLRKNFLLDTVINKSGFSAYGGIQRYSLSVPAKSFPRFLDLIHVYRTQVPTMVYKFKRPRND